MNLTARNVTLCGVIASIGIITAGVSSLMMTGCGTDTTFVCDPGPKDAGVADTGEDGGDAEPVDTNPCD
jgi:hypothetical protein